MKILLMKMNAVPLPPFAPELPKVSYYYSDVKIYSCYKIQLTTTMAVTTTMMAVTTTMMAAATMMMATTVTATMAIAKSMARMRKWMETRDPMRAETIGVTMKRVLKAIMATKPWAHRRGKVDRLYLNFFLRFYL